MAATPQERGRWVPLDRPPVWAALAGFLVGLVLPRLLRLQPLPRPADRDDLTGLLTRGGFRQRLQSAVATTGTVALVDLNRLKRINDQHGHRVGDVQLVRVAHALEAALPPRALLARWGGDEFLAWVPGTSVLDLNQRLRTLQRQTPSLVPGQPAFVFGTADLPFPAQLDRALTVADHELYLAKGEGEVSAQALGEDRGLFDFSVQLAKLNTPEEIIRHGLQLARSLLQFEVAVFSYVEGEQAQTAYIDSDPAVGSLRLALGDTFVLTQLGLQAVQDHCTVVSHDYPTDPGGGAIGELLGTKSTMITPVERGGQVIGLLSMTQVSTWKALPLRAQWVLELAALRLGHALELQQAVSTVRRTLEGGLLGLGVALEARDLETHGHTERVVRWAVALGQALGLPAKRLEELRQGAYLHDIGKLSVPDRILLKPGPLDAEEWAIMQTHVTTGTSIAERIPNLSPGAVEVISAHHERWDGRGYPAGLRGEQIPLLARIFAVGDVYDALTTDRPYKRAWTPQEAWAELAAQAGLQFDPEVVRAFLTLVKASEPGGLPSVP